MTQVSAHQFNPLAAQGSITPEEAQDLIQKNPKNKDVLFPYLNGEDLNSRPDQSPSRWVINFFDWPIERAMEYKDCFKIVEEKVKPERLENNDRGARDLWWRFLRPRPELYSTIAGMERVLVCTRVSKHMNFFFAPNGIIYTLDLFVFSHSRYSDFALLQSNFHESWVRVTSSTHETRLRYTATDCYETFPFPESTTPLEATGISFYEAIAGIMGRRGEGLTKTYNRFHNPKEDAGDIRKLRELHVEMDYAVARAYGWSDLDLGHGFHETKQGIRYTLHEEARREVLDRLLALNHERYEEEVRQGLHDKGRKKGGGKGRTAKPETGSAKKDEGQGRFF